MSVVPWNAVRVACCHWMVAHRHTHWPRSRTDEHYNYWQTAWRMRNSSLYWSTGTYEKRRQLPYCMQCPVLYSSGQVDGSIHMRLRDTSTLNNSNLIHNLLRLLQSTYFTSWPLRIFFTTLLQQQLAHLAVCLIFGRTWWDNRIKETTGPIRDVGRQYYQSPILSPHTTVTPLHHNPPILLHEECLDLRSNNGLKKKFLILLFRSAFVQKNRQH